MKYKYYCKNCNVNYNDEWYRLWCCNCGGLLKVENENNEIMTVKILAMKAKPFETEDGMMDYFWYKAQRAKDGVTFEFGSRDGGHAIGTVCDLNLGKFETSNGKIRYKEIMEV